MPHFRRILIDTNLLVLWIYGSVEPRLVGTGRTTGYTVDDFYLLDAHLQNYEEVLITPSVAAEVSNFMGKLEGDYRRAAMAILQLRLQVWEERYTPSRELSRDRAFAWAGLADVGLRHAAGKSIAVITTDARLYNWLLKEGVEAINFNHLRFPR